jgi:hypothetical protein
MYYDQKLVFSVSWSHEQSGMFVVDDDDDDDDDDTEKINRTIIIS